MGVIVNWKFQNTIYKGLIWWTAELSGFYVKYKVTVKQKAYAEAVQRLLYQYNHYIHLKLEEDDSALAKSLTGYPGELDEVKRGSLEEIRWEYGGESLRQMIGVRL